MIAKAIGPFNGCRTVVFEFPAEQLLPESNVEDGAGESEVVAVVDEEVGEVITLLQQAIATKRKEKDIRHKRSRSNNNQDNKMERTARFQRQTATTRLQLMIKVTKVTDRHLRQLLDVVAVAPVGAEDEVAVADVVAEDAVDGVEEEEEEGDTTVTTTTVDGNGGLHQKHTRHIWKFLSHSRL
mmetsp:Transcript_23413/g.65133  ORF Transcript_23413/g.65133 Transcript_23413/m.65133 type:complete len:183 (-) Transcript_23413:14-562(-)